jgi:methyltransferase (TIGR00027 family)
MQNPAEIRDVSDTAIWVAFYRARETDRPDAMFRDPLARELVGERGAHIARAFGPMSRYTEWTVLSRTVNIDDFITEGIRNGVDAVVNIGAGLDTRPYRMDLPATLQWVEADFPHMVEFKDTKLAARTPRCQLQRVGVDLGDDDARRGFLANVVPHAKRVLVLTEGVVPYLTEAQVASLARELRSHPKFAFWLTEYFAPQVYPYLRATARSRRMRNAPFQFYPRDWIGFFQGEGWEEKEIRYASSIMQRFKRRPPMPWWGRLLLKFANQEAIDRMRKSSGFMLMTPRGS